MFVRRKQSLHIDTCPSPSKMTNLFIPLDNFQHECVLGFLSHPPNISLDLTTHQPYRTDSPRDKPPKKFLDVTETRLWQPH